MLVVIVSITVVGGAVAIVIRTSSTCTTSWICALRIGRGWSRSCCVEFEFLEIFTHANDLEDELPVFAIIINTGQFADTIDSALSKGPVFEQTENESLEEVSARGNTKVDVGGIEEEGYAFAHRTFILGEDVVTDLQIVFLSLGKWSCTYRKGG